MRIEWDVQVHDDENVNLDVNGCGAGSGIATVRLMSTG